MDCRKFEYLLWENPSKYSDRENFPEEMAKHLDVCSTCQQAYSDYSQLLEISKAGEIVRGDDYWQNFEGKVWDEIEHIEQAMQSETSKKISGKKYIRQPEIRFRHLVFSLSVAVAAVFFIFIAISDVTKQMAIIEKPEIALGVRGKMAAPISQATPRAFNVLLNRGIDGAIQLQEFSILPEPEVDIIDESALVAIDAVYLTDEGIENEDIEITRALSKEIVMGNARASLFEEKYQAEKSARAESDLVITFEKMPSMKKAVTPKYPALAYRMKKTGEVWIKARVDNQGRVVKAMVYKDSGIDYGFEEEALKAAYENEFEPFEINGNKLPVWVIYKVRFVMKE